MRTYQEAYDTALDRPAFSNGTEGHAWLENWCETCIHDRVARDDTDPAGCPLVRVSLMGRTPSEWLEQDRMSFGDQYHCVEYRDEEDPGPGYEPVEPVSPDQMELFDAEPWRRVRMYGGVASRELVAL